MVARKGVQEGSAEMGLGAAGVGVRATLAGAGRADVFLVRRADWM
jgi:hypothetical protein